MNKIIYIILVGGLLLGASSCQKTFLNLNPQDTFTDVVYFKQPSDFKTYTTGFYSQLMGWNCPYSDGIYNYMDLASDLSTYFSGGFSVDEGRGTLTIPTGDTHWDKSYSWIRSTNILLSKAAAYTGSGDISQYVSEAYFFRANAYFNLLKYFGGVPLVTTVLDVNSAALTGPRNSRYEVVTQILSDLDNAIAHLPSEQSIPATDKGRISKWAAEAFKAQVELYEATWRKYNSTTTDFTGSAGPASNQIAQFLTDAAALTKDVMDNGGYALWNYNTTPSILNQSYIYLFNLEDAGSNPAGLTKASNNEFILYGVYDYTLRRGGVNLTWTSWMMTPSRKMIDMFLCTDGLPPAKSPLFQGYHAVGDEYQNRDLRLSCYVNPAPASGSVKLVSGGAGYGNTKFAAYKYGTYRTDNTESPNYSIIRLAGVYLMYAEALYELNGSITDAQLDASINKIRDRAGVAHLSNALVTANGLNMLDEIRRERTLELYHEGFRYDDLKRWGIAETALNASACGEVVGDASYTTEFRDATGAATSLYTPSVYVWGEEAVTTAAGTLNCIVIDSKANHHFAKKDYLYPIPQGQINLNPNLKQNPGF
ncbi:MAG TPA: RagB/SusD family nutrient uptake outer membrane protein [Puia sp.]|nr:RagB/SusD family nutrient uptake outer membrane protein [Puia sp.]